MVNVGSAADPIVTRLVEEDKTPWYKKPNLRLMYVWLFCCCMGVEMTSGFDSQLINTLQFAPTFHKCKYLLNRACFTVASVENVVERALFFDNGKGSEYPRFIHKGGPTIWVKARPIESKRRNHAIGRSEFVLTWE
jgi:hypothetical protein